MANWSRRGGGVVGSELSEWLQARSHISAKKKALGTSPETMAVDLFFHITSRAEGTKVLAQGDRVRYDERFSQRSGRVEAFVVALLMKRLVQFFRYWRPRRLQRQRAAVRRYWQRAKGVSSGRELG